VAWMPPSAEVTSPVMERAASEARKTTTSATSSGFERRRVGIRSQDPVGDRLGEILSLRSDGWRGRHAGSGQIPLCELPSDMSASVSDDSN
jgi:hypothetical protein